MLADVILGFVIRLIIIALIAGILKIKFTTLPSFLGPITIAWYFVSPNPAMDPWIVVGLVLPELISFTIMCVGVKSDKKSKTKTAKP